MNLEELDLEYAETLIFRLRGLYSRQGYTRFRMNKFEEYDLYASNKEFLVSDRVMTFTDGNGKLLALKPDVTLSIVKSTRDEPGTVRRLYYDETVYRPGRDGSYREMQQVGLECLGAIDSGCIAQVLQLAEQSLRTISGDAVLQLSHLGLLVQVMDAAGIPENKRRELLQCIGEKNSHGIAALCARWGAEETAAGVLCRMVTLSGPAETVLPRLRQLLEGIADPRSLEELEAAARALEGRAVLDLSMADDLNYYNGILFRGFLPGIPESVLSGGQYDNLMRRFGRRSGAVGFAVYADVLHRLRARPAPETPMLNVALPKGRLGEKVYAMFEAAGYPCDAIREPNRKLVFENPEAGVRYFWVKPSDVAIYVERGAADIGVAGKDILLEYQPEVYELLDLGLGKCRMAVAAMEDFQEDPGRPLRVATKFAGIAARHYLGKGRDIDIIHLNGSIEIAPLLGLSDVIVDIVETGQTLRENRLCVVETVVPISARLIANRAAYPFKKQQIDTLVENLSRRLEE